MATTVKSVTGRKSSSTNKMRVRLAWESRASKPSSPCSTASLPNPITVSTHTPHLLRRRQTKHRPLSHPGGPARHPRHHLAYFSLVQPPTKHPPNFLHLNTDQSIAKHILQRQSIVNIAISRLTYRWHSLVRLPCQIFTLRSISDQVPDQQPWRPSLLRLEGCRRRHLVGLASLASGSLKPCLEWLGGHPEEVLACLAFS